MPRKKIISDTEVFAIVRNLLAEGGDKAVAFGSVARATGLAASTLVQRFQKRENMVRAALADAWDQLDAACAEAENNTTMGQKGASAFLKTLGAEATAAADLSLLAIDFRDAQLRARAEGWRTRVETALAYRLGSGARARETAAILFAVWMGQVLWQPAGGKGFKIKDALKRLD